VFTSRLCVALGLVMLAEIVMVRGLMMVMCGGMMMRCSAMVMLA
jgi:hypothetical protein